MRKIVLITCVLVLMLGGCALLDPVEKGSRTTFDAQGNKIAVEDYAIGDKYTEYTDAAVAVSGAGKEVLTKQIDAIAAYTAVKEGDSAEVAAWKNATGVVAVSHLQDRTPDIISSIKYGKDKYDVSSEGVGAGKAIGTTSLITYGGIRIAEEIAGAAGDKIRVTGDGNSIEKNEINNDIHANTTGDNSSPAVTTDSSAKCKDGNCEDEAESGWYNDIVGCSSAESYNNCLCTDKPATCE